MFYFKYKQISKINFKHTFYKNGISTDFAINPLPETEELLKSYDLVFQQEEGALLYQKINKNDIPFQAIDEAIDLFFTVKISSNIMNITPPTYDNEGKEVRQFWLSNLINVHANTETEEAGERYKTTLTKSSELSALDQSPNTLNDTWKNTKAAATLHQLLRQRSMWGILHLQLIQGAIAPAYHVSIPPKKSKWYYFLHKSEGSDFSESDFEFKYTKEDTESRYPDQMDFELTSFNELEDSEKQLLEIKLQTLESMPQIEKVFVFNSASELQLFEDTPPQVTLKKVGGNTLNNRLEVPTRKSMTTVIDCTL